MLTDSRLIGGRSARGPNPGLTRLLRAAPARAVAPLTVLLVVKAALLAVQPLLLGVVVGRVSAVASGGGLAGLAAPLGWLVAALLAAAVVQAAAAAARPRLVRAVDGLVRREVRAVFDADPGLGRVEDPRAQDDAVAALEGAHGVRLGTAAADLLWMVFQYANALLLALVVARVSVPAAVVLGAAVVVGRVVSIRWGPMRTVPEGGAAEAERRAGYLQELAVGAGAAKEVRVFGTAEWLADRATRAWEAFYAPQLAAGRGRLPRFALLYTGLAAAYCAGLAPLVESALDGRTGVAGLTAAASAAAAMLMSLGGGFDSYLFAGRPVAAFERLTGRRQGPAPGSGATAAGGAAHADGDVDGAVGEDADGRAKAALPPAAPARGIRFEQVAFRYPGAARPVFTGLSFELGARESVGLVGLNGAGKTTLVKLLTAMYRPDAGRITVDGVDLARVDPVEWRARLAVLFQDFVRYELPLRDNIGYGRPGWGGDAELHRAVGEAGLRRVLERLPEGLDTPLSSAYRGGTDLSGGEWQRTALARALFALRGGARVLVLDEPTAAYDVRAEEELFGRFLELTSGRSTLLISHRLSAVRRADRVLVLDGGRITEDGPHAELLAAGGTYARLFTLQADGVRKGLG